MPEWLTHTISTSSVDPAVLAGRLVLAAIFGAAVALAYRMTHGRSQPEGSALATTLVLLCILTAMVSVVIGDSVARAFGLVGALSIVRFRTVVDDTRDTAFVIFAVIVGMGVGAGLILVPLIGIPIVTVAAFAMHRLERPGNGGPEHGWLLQIRMGLGRSPQQIVGESFERHLASALPTAASTARQGTALDVTYRVQLRAESELTALIAELNQLEGIQSVEIREPADD